MKRLSDEERHWLLELTALPTAAGVEWRVVDWIKTWAAQRDDLRLTTDDHGNVYITRHDVEPGEHAPPPLYITAHLDHPAFVVTGAFDDGARLELEFRGGVLDPYFSRAPIVAYSREDEPVRAMLTSAGPADPFRACTAKVAAADCGAASRLKAGDVARWDLPEPEILRDEKHGEIVRTHACDDLAALVAALAAMDRLRHAPEARHVGLMLTRAEEVGFIGAIAACRSGAVDRRARLVLLENSRSFDDSPIGGGPIVRVGDRISTFSPTLTAAFAKLAENLKKQADEQGLTFAWQRKLMPGGACEATAYQAYGYEAACLCLPLGNYHNMAELQRVQDGEPEAVEHARCAPEFVSMADVAGLVDLLVAAGRNLEPAQPLRHRMERLFAERGGVLTP